MSGFLLHSNQLTVSYLTDLLEFPNGTSPQADKRNRLIFQWGTPRYEHAGDQMTVLNAAQAIKNCSSHQQIWAILRLNGIPTIQAGEQDASSLKYATVRRYYVFVFQTSPIALYRSRGKKIWLKNFQEQSYSDTFEELDVRQPYRDIRKALQYAKRSVYALGLDFGGVLIGKNLAGKLKVIHVQPAPALNKRLARKIAAAFHTYAGQFQAKDTRSKQVILGADPEFVLRSPEGKLVLASRFFNKKGSVGCDQIWLRGDRTRSRHPLAELRPKPAAEPRELTVNLYKTMLIALKKINRSSVQWLAGGMPFKGYPIGGHIHFSRTWLNYQLIRALDNYLCLPLFIIEDPRSLSRRPRYGFLGDYRRQNHGGFEYRTLPSWLISPTVTKGVFSLAKVIAHGYWQLPQTPLSDPQVQEAFYQGRKKELLPIVRILWEDLRRVREYGKYEKELEKLKKLIDSEWVWNDKTDIRPRWKLPVGKRV